MLFDLSKVDKDQTIGIKGINGVISLIQVNHSMEQSGILSPSCNHKDLDFNLLLTSSIRVTLSVSSMISLCLNSSATNFINTIVRGMCTTGISKEVVFKRYGRYLVLTEYGG